jgi:hypothetical protein
MEVGNREPVSCIFPSAHGKSYYWFGFLGSCGDMWRESWMYTGRLGRTIVSHYVNLNTSRSAAGA